MVRLSRKIDKIHLLELVDFVLLNVIHLSLKDSLSSCYEYSYKAFAIYREESRKYCRKYYIHRKV